MSALYQNNKLQGLSVGSRIAFIRKLRGMTQMELGNAIGILGKKGRNVICRYERTARVPRDDILQNIANALDTDTWADPAEVKRGYGYELDKKI